MTELHKGNSMKQRSRKAIEFRSFSKYCNGWQNVNNRCKFYSVRGGCCATISSTRPAWQRWPAAIVWESQGVIVRSKTFDPKGKKK